LIPSPWALDHPDHRLPDILKVAPGWGEFKANDVADLINMVHAYASLDIEILQEMKRDSATLRDCLFGNVPASFVASTKSVGLRLKAHVDEPVRHEHRTLVLRKKTDRTDTFIYFVGTAG
jgi:hypothetical protein